MAFLAVTIIGIVNAFVLLVVSGHVVPDIPEAPNTRSRVAQEYLPYERSTSEKSTGMHQFAQKRSGKPGKERTKMQDIPKVVMSHTGTYGHKSKTKVVQDAKILFNNQPANFHRSKGYKPYHKPNNRKAKLLGRSKGVKRHETLHKMPLVEESPVKKERLRPRLTSINLPSEDHIPIVGHNSKAKLSSGKSIPIDSIEPLDMLEPMSFISVEENESLKKKGKEELQENARKRSEPTIMYGYRPRHHNEEPEDIDHDPTVAKHRPMGAFGTFKPPKVFPNPFKNTDNNDDSDHDELHDNEEEEPDEEEYFVKNNNVVEISPFGEESLEGLDNLESGNGSTEKRSEEVETEEEYGSTEKRSAAEENDASERVNGEAEYGLAEKRSAEEKQGLTKKRYTEEECGSTGKRSGDEEDCSTTEESSGETEHGSTE